jgi:hypothetical protein
MSTTKIDFTPFRKGKEGVTERVGGADGGRFW